MTTETKTTKSEWRVEGSKASAKIVVNCSEPACKSSLSFGGSIEDALRLRFQHNLCGGFVEQIPRQIWQEYRDRKFDPEKAK